MIQITLNIKSFDLYTIKKSIIKIYQIVSFFEDITVKTICIPGKKRKYTVLRSPHIDKKSREQFEIRRYKIQLMLYLHQIPSISFLLFLIKNSTFPGVEIQILYKNSTYF